MKFKTWLEDTARLLGRRPIPAGRDSNYTVTSVSGDAITAGEFFIVARSRRVLNVLGWFEEARRGASPKKQTPVLIFRPWGSDRVYLVCDLGDARKVGEAIGRNRQKIEDLRELVKSSGERRPAS